MFARKPAADVQAQRKRLAWFPSTKTPEGAAEAAKQTAWAAFALAGGYVLTDVLMAGFNFDPLKIGAGPLPLIVNAVVAGLAALLGWRCLRKPGLIKAGLVLAWVVLEFVTKVEALKSANVGMYWLNVYMTLAAINGVRGALALRKPFNAEAATA